MFERGYKVIFIGDERYYDLTIGKFYTVKSSFINIEDCEQIIQVVNDKNKFIWIRSSFFKIGICEERKQKLKKICSK